MYWQLLTTQELLQTTPEQDMQQNVCWGKMNNDSEQKRLFNGENNRLNARRIKELQ